MQRAVTTGQGAAP